MSTKSRNFKSLSIGIGIVGVAFAGFISLLLSISVDMSTYELGALINYLWPPFLTVLAIIVYLICCWISKDPKIRLIVMLILSLYLLYVGVALHLEKDYWPLVEW